jgi:hypothetical protein
MKEFFCMHTVVVLGRDFPNCYTIEDHNRACATEPYSNRIRSIVNFLCNNLWGDDYFQFLEKQVMDIAKVR